MKEDKNGIRHGSGTVQTERSNTESVLDTSLSRKGTLVRGELADLEALREESGRKNLLRDTVTKIYENILYHVQVVQKYPRIALYAFLVLSVLCASGLSIVFTVANNQDEANQAEALTLATETGQWFCKLLNERILIDASYLTSFLTSLGVESRPIR